MFKNVLYLFIVQYKVDARSLTRLYFLNPGLSRVFQIVFCGVCTCFIMLLIHMLTTRDLRLVCHDIKLEIVVKESTNDISFDLQPFFQGHLWSNHAISPLLFIDC